MLRSVVAAEKSAASLARQTEIAIAAELPSYALASIQLLAGASQDGLKFDEIPPGDFPDDSFVVVALANMGRSNTAVEDLCFSIEVKSDDELPPEPVYTRRISPARIIAGGVTEGFGLQLAPLTPTPDERKRLNSGEAKLWVYGMFGCRNFLGEQVDFGFAANWAVVNKSGDPPVGFMLLGPPNYSFVRRRKEGEDLKLPDASVASAHRASLKFV